MKKVFALVVAALLGAVLVACGPAMDSGSRISMISEGTIVQRFIYDDAGHLEAIIENDTPDDVAKPNRNIISFNADGSIASVTTDHVGLKTEVVDESTWRMYTDDGFSITITYDENHFIVKQIVEVAEMIVTTEIKRDASGRALSRTSTAEYSDIGMDTETTTINYTYDYDDAGRYVVQYFEDETSGGACIGESYAWE